MQRSDSGRILQRLAVMFLGVLTTACTHLETRPAGEVQRVPLGEAAVRAQTGISYALPMVQYDLKITRSLDSCPTGSNEFPRLTIRIEATERYVAGERFEVDYEAMSSIMKTSNFDITYHDTGTLRSINARAEDQTGPVLTNIARIGLAVTSVATGVPLPVSSEFMSTLSTANQTLVNQWYRRETREGPVPIVRLRCRPEVVQNLEALASGAARVRALTADIVTLTSRVNRLSELAALEVITEPDKILLRETVQTLLTKEEELRSLNAQMTTIQSALSVTEERVWPNVAGSNSAHEDSLTAGPAALARLWTLFEVQVENGPPLPAETQATAPIACGAAGVIRAARDCLGDLTRLNLAIRPAIVESPLAAGAGPSGTGPEQQSEVRRRGDERRNTRRNDRSAIVARGQTRWARGVYVREPVEARLVICRDPGQPVSGGCDPPLSEVFRDELVVAPQLGRLRLLPFTNGPFEDNELKLELRPNGLIEHFSYGEESSAAAATNALVDIAERTQTALENMETERRSDIQYARETQAYMRTEAAANRAEELAQLTHQVEMLRRERERLTEQAAFDDTTRSIQTEAEQARIDAEVKMIEARIARLRAAAELAALNEPETDRR